jgi:hypothetical protein
MANPDTANLPVLSSDSETLFTAFNGDGMSAGLNKLINVITAEIAKYGTGDSTPGVAGNVLYATSASASAYGPRAQIRLAETLLVGSTASITFSSIPQTFRGLMVMWRARDVGVGTTLSSMLMQLNGDNGNNYDYQLNSGNGSSITTGENLAGSAIRIGSSTNGGAVANAFGSGAIWIPNYIGTTGHKECNYTAGVKWGTSTGTLATNSGSGWWRNTAAITSITLFVSGNNMAAGSYAALYGIPQ